jgi:transposase
MPWQECSKMDERLRFVARLPEGEKMAVLCREFDISRKTGYKIFSRYKNCGLEGLTDRMGSVGSMSIPDARKAAQQIAGRDRRLPPPAAFELFIIRHECALG